ncbi:MAG: glycosyltransferase, partial [Coprothermobacterota bacterium]|nr:glycosyltransferase [Coprothermobacterota bacterium]
FTGYRNDPLDIVEAMDIIVLTSISEGLPVTLLEAMSRSKPVVATRVGGIPEVVQDGRTGFLSASGDAQDFAGKILKLLQDPAKSRWLGEQGRRWALDHFSLSGMVDQTEQIYREVLAE